MKPQNIKEKMNIDTKVSIDTAIGALVLIAGVTVGLRAIAVGATATTAEKKEEGKIEIKKVATKGPGQLVQAVKRAIMIAHQRKIKEVIKYF